MHVAANCEPVSLFMCKICNVTFDSHQEKVMHNMQHGNTCDICGKEYLTHARMMSHRKVHDEKNSQRTVKAFTCEYCKKTFSLHACYLKHVSLHTGVKPFECSTCPSRFSKIAERDNHEKYCGDGPS